MTLISPQRSWSSAPGTRSLMNCRSMRLTMPTSSMRDSGWVKNFAFSAVRSPSSPPSSSSARSAAMVIAMSPSTRRLNGFDSGPDGASCSLFFASAWIRQAKTSLPDLSQSPPGSRWSRRWTTSGRAMNGPRSFSGKGEPASLPACAIAGESPASIAAPSAAINVGPLRPRRIDVTGGKGSVACSRPPRVEDGARAGGALGVGQARRIGDVGIDRRFRRERRRWTGVGQARIRRAQWPARLPSGSLFGAERIAGAVDVEGDVAAEAVGALAPRPDVQGNGLPDLPAGGRGLRRKEVRDRLLDRRQGRARMRRPVLEEAIVDLGRLESVRGIGSEEGRDLAAVEARALVEAVEGGAHCRHLPDRGEARLPRRPPGAVGPDAAQIGLEAAGRVAVSHPEHPADGGGFAGEARVEERWRRGIDRLEDELHLTAAAAGGIRQAPHSRSRHWTAARLRPGPPPDSGMRAYALEPNTRESEDARPRCSLAGLKGSASASAECDHGSRAAK